MSLSIGRTKADVLSLAKRGLTEVPTASLPGSLTSLDISENLLGSNGGALALPPLPLLMELRLADNVLDAVTLQRAAPLPPQLHVLDLGSNRLTVLPPCVLRLTSLIALHVDRQQLRVLPAELSLLPALAELDAGFNEISAALQLAEPGLPALRRLVLRSNSLATEQLTLDPNHLPRLTELDVSGNMLTTWPDCVGKLDSLNRLILANNRLTTLVSTEMVPHKRMWVPASGLHTLPNLVELSLAQNALADLPAALNQLRALRRLDVRCNPLTPASVALATTHCTALDATLLSSALRTAAPGVLLGDASSAWHRPTLLRAQVKYILSVGDTPPDGVPAERLAAKLPAEYRLLGLPTPSKASEPAQASEETAGATAPMVNVTVESLRRAFHAAALRLHPDKQLTDDPAAQEAAAHDFAQLQEAYRTLGRAVAMERRRLPQLDGFSYHFVDLPRAVDGIGQSGTDEHAIALAESFSAQLTGLLAFARDARAAANGGLLVHCAGGGSSAAHAVLLAVLLDGPNASTSAAAAARALAPGLGLSAEALLDELPVPLADVLHGLAKQRLRAAVEVSYEGDDGAEPASASGGLVRRNRASGKYDPVLTMSRDPFASEADRGSYAPELTMDNSMDGMTLGFGGIDIGIDLGDPGPAESSAAVAERFGASSASVFGANDAAPVTASFDIGGDDPVGWSVDATGRSVLTLPKGARYASVIVEHEEGARRSHAQGGEGGGSKSFSC